MEDLVIEEEGASSALKITLGDFLIFINWMNQTEKSLDRAEALPPLPDVDSGKVKGWIQLVQRLEERFRRSEEKKLALEANVIAQEAQLGQLLSHLHANIASLYDNLGQSQKAEEVRRRAEALHVSSPGRLHPDRPLRSILTTLRNARSLSCICLQGVVTVVTGEDDTMVSHPSRLSVAMPLSSFRLFLHRIIEFLLSSLVTWLYLSSYSRWYCHRLPFQM